jgi:hypothetical protein
MLVPVSLILSDVSFVDRAYYPDVVSSRPPRWGPLAGTEYLETTPSPVRLAFVACLEVPRI